MPVIFFKEVADECWLGVWKITESEKELLELSGRALLPDNFFFIKSELQRKQSLSGRLLIKQLALKMYDTFLGMYKNKQGKPLLNNLDGHISISHSKQYAVAISHKAKSVGIDIEKISPRMDRVISRVCSAEEQSNINDHKNATFYWCAKEAMYKLYGKEGLHFNQQLLVMPPNKLQGVIIDADMKIEVQLSSMEVEDFVLVWAVEK